MSKEEHTHSTLIVMLSVHDLLPQTQPLVADLSSKPTQSKPMDWKVFLLQVKNDLSFINDIMIGDDEDL